MVVFLLVHEDYNCIYSLALSTDIGGKIERKALTAPDTWHLLSNKTERAQWEKGVSSLRGKGPLYSSQCPKDVLTLGWAGNQLVTFCFNFDIFKILSEKSQEYYNEWSKIFHTDSPNINILLYLFFLSLCIYMCVYIHIYNLYDYAYLLYTYVCISIFFLNHSEKGICRQDAPLLLNTLVYIS